jgi:hypothetical protein
LAGYIEYMRVHDISFSEYEPSKEDLVASAEIKAEIKEESQLAEAIHIQDVLACTDLNTLLVADKKTQDDFKAVTDHYNEVNEVTVTHSIKRKNRGFTGLHDLLGLRDGEMRIQDAEEKKKAKVTRRNRELERDILRSFLIDCNVFNSDSLSLFGSLFNVNVIQRAIKKHSFNLALFKLVQGGSKPITFLNKILKSRLGLVVQATQVKIKSTPDCKARVIRNYRIDLDWLALVIPNCDSVADYSCIQRKPIVCYLEKKESTKTDPEGSNWEIQPKLIKNPTYEHARRGDFQAKPKRERIDKKTQDKNNSFGERDRYSRSTRTRPILTHLVFSSVPPVLGIHKKPISGGTESDSKERIKV